MAQHLGLSQLNCLEEGNVSIVVGIDGRQVAVESLEVLRGQDSAEDGDVLEVSRFVGVL